MTTNKPEVVGFVSEAGIKNLRERNYACDWTLYARPVRNSTTPLIRLSDYEALQAECEKLRKDAERYRWLRLQVGVQLTGSQTYPASPYLLVSPPARESIAESTDSAIDAAMETTK